MRCFNKPFHLFPNVTHSAAAAVVACGGCFFLPTPQDPVAAGIGIIFTFRPQTLSNRLLRTCEALVPRRFRPYPLAPVDPQTPPGGFGHQCLPLRFRGRRRGGAVVPKRRRLAAVAS